MDKKDNTYFLACRQISKIANSDLPLKKALNSIAKKSAKSMRAAGCSIMLLSPHKEHLFVIAAYGLSDTYIRKGVLNAYSSLPEIIEGEISSITEITHDKRAQFPEEAEKEKINAILGVPLHQNGAVIEIGRAHV